MNGIRAIRSSEKLSSFPVLLESFRELHCGIISFTFHRPSDTGKRKAFLVTSGERRSLKYALDMGDHRHDPCRCMVSM